VASSPIQAKSGPCSPEIQTPRGTCRVADLDLTARVSSTCSRSSAPTTSQPGTKTQTTLLISIIITASVAGVLRRGSVDGGKPFRPPPPALSDGLVAFFAAGGCAGVRCLARPRSRAFPLSMRPPMFACVRRPVRPSLRLDAYQDWGILFAKIRFNRVLVDRERRDGFDRASVFLRRRRDPPTVSRTFPAPFPSFHARYALP
jgi:hypothetical protein